MALPKLHGIGQLVSDPKTGTTKTGGTWCNAVVKFVRWAKGDGGGWIEADSTIAVAMAFDDYAVLLAGFAKGDNVEIVGAVSAGIWQDKPQLKVTVAACRRPPDDRPKRALNRGAAAHGPGFVDGAVKNAQRSDQPFPRRREFPVTATKTRSHLQAVR